MATVIPDLGRFGPEDGLIPLAACSDDRFRPGADGVISVAATGDGKVEFVAFADHTLAYVRSALGYPAYYPVHPVALERPVRAVLMDLDGTSVRSERFWIWIIEQTTASLLGDPHFALEENDLPYVSGHSVSEHLEHCIRKYCPGRTVEEARGGLLRAFPTRNAGDPRRRRSPPHRRVCARAGVWGNSCWRSENGRSRSRW